MRGQGVWFLGFAAAYAAHALAAMAAAGALPLGLGEGAARLAALLTLGALLALLGAYIATRDEVLRRMALIAAAASALLVGAASYALRFVAAPAALSDNLWALGVAVWLIVYGAMAWQARS
jgi:hypothetical protein